MMNETIPDIRNKLTAPLIALEKLFHGEKVPPEFLELALDELKSALALLKEVRGWEFTRAGEV